jgi:hypothetical protein
MKITFTTNQIGKFRPSIWTRLIAITDNIVLIFGAYQFWSGEYMIAGIALLASMAIYWQELNCMAFDFATYTGKIAAAGELEIDKDSDS